MFISKKKYDELREFSKMLQYDNNKLISDNRALRRENNELKLILKMRKIKI